MIVSNKKQCSIKKDMEFGALHQIVLGEYGRGRRELRLTCPEGCTLERGLNRGITIASTKSGKPRISQTDCDNEVYLILDCKGGYTRRGCGWVGGWCNNTAKYTLIAKGNGADGDAGRIGYWDVLLLKVDGTPECDWIRIRTGGGGYGTSPQWLAITTKGYFLFEETEDAREFADSIDAEFPDIDADVEKVFKDLG